MIDESNIEIVSLLTTGISGNIYKIKFKNTDCILKKYFYLSDLKNELNILKSFNNSRIISIISETSNGLILEDWGIDLKKYLNKTKIDFKTKLKIMIQILEGCEYIHSMGIVHCDLKPENILIKNEEIKIIDFGSSKLEGSPNNRIETTINYSSLEYLLGIEDVLKSFDIWSLGCIFYEIINERCLIESTNTFRAINEIITKIGIPSNEDYREYNIRYVKDFNLMKNIKNEYLLDQFEFPLINGKNILSQFFKYNPNERITIKKALKLLNEELNE